MRNNFLNLVAYDPIAEPCAAKMPQNTGGGTSRTKNRSVTVNLSSATTTNREMTERRPREDRETFVLRFLKYAACMLMILFVGVGNVWAIDYYTPTDDVEIIYMLNSAGDELVSHAALTNTAKEVQQASKKCGDPTTVYTTPAPTSGSVNATKIKVDNSAKMVQLDIAGCSEIVACHESHSSRHVKATITEDGKDATTQAGSNSTYFTTITLNGKKSYRVQLEGDNNDLGLYAVVLKKAPDCDDPEPSFTAAKTLAEINEEVALTFSSSNTNAVSYSIKKGGLETSDASISAGKFAATVAGTYVVTAIQDADAGGHCAVEKTVTIKVASLLTGWVIFDGLVDEEARTSPVTYNTVSMTYETSTVTMVDAGTKTLDGTTRAYSKLMQIAKSTGGYLKFTIPEGYTATFTHAFSGTGNRTIILASAKINSTSSEGYIATLCSATSSTIKWGEYTTPLAAGDYYICDCNNGNWQIAELVFNLVAATKYTVTYDLNGGSGTTPTETDKAEGAKFNLHNGTTSITAPTDKEFSKWVDQDDNEYDGGAEFTMPGENVTLTAKWVDAVTRYTVTYDLNGGEGDAPTETDKAAAEVFALAAAPTRAGYNFTGWLCDIDSKVKTAGANYTMTAAPTTFTAQWEAYVACVSVVPATEGESPALAGDPISVTGTGATFSMLNNQTTGKTGDITYSTSGLLFANASGVGVVVTLDHLMKAGTVITATISADYKNDANRGLLLHNASGTKKADWVWKPATDALQEEKVFTYTVVADDGLAGNNVFRIVRSTNAWLKSLTVSNCGAELIYYDLTSAVDPTGKGSVTLSAASLLEGETATATYAISDENYEFDEWQISGTGATLSSTTANPTTITMGSIDAVVTLKLKEKAGFAVTYKANNGTEEADVVVSKESTFAANTFTAPEGKMFAGWNTQDDGEGTNYTVGAAVEAATTVYAKWIVDPTIRLIKKVGEEYVLNTTDFEFNSAKTTLQTADYTVEDVVYPKNVKLGGTATAVTGINADKYIAYHTKTNSTHVEIALYDAYSSNTTHNVYIARVKEGNGTPEIETVAIVTGTKRDYYKSYDLTGRTSLYIYVGNDNARVCQVYVTENGEPNVADAPAEGYSINLNKGRMFAASGVAKSFEGLTYVVAEDYQPTNRTALKIKTQNTHYISFEIPTGQTRQLQLTASGSYNVSKTQGDESAYVSGNQNINLTEGVWYINPNGSNVSITNITFAAAPDALTVTFKDGATPLGTQNVWSGEKATALNPAPEKDGYRFVKWQKEGVDYDFDDEVTADITLDAVWQQVVTVTFAPANGEENFTKTADKGATLAAGDRPADPEYAGHVFQGWTRNTSAEPVVYVDLATETFDANATLTAVWEVAQTDATISALSYNGNAINVASAEDVAGVATYTVHLQWGTAIDKDLISVTKTASSATVGTIAYDSEAKKATFTVTAGDGTTTADYAIQFVIDAKRGTSIIKATTNNVVTGLIGGTIDQSYSGNANSRKLNKGNYFGVTLANDETFQEGDVFIVNIATAADLGKFMVFADKDRTELIADQGIVYTKPEVASPVVCPAGEMMLVLPAAANGKKSLYLSRENVDNSEQWNVTFSYIEVTREMAPAIKSFKFGENAATINESAKTISIDVPYATDVTALTPTVEAYGNNGATYTPDGATDFTTSVNYVVTDAYGELSTTYAVTVNVAAPSENAYLASLSVTGYALDFNKETTTYNVVLDYGTTVLPEITYAVEDVGLATAVKVENGVNGATTITVTPQAGAGYEKVYTVNFSVSTTPKFVIYDGSTMTNIPAATGSDVTTGFSWSMASGIGLTGDNVAGTWQGKNYAHAIKGFKPNDNTSNIVSFVIPENYLAKVRLVGSTNSDTKERSMFIAKAASRDVADAFENYVVTSSTYVAQGIITNLMLPGTYYLGSTDACRLFELSVQLYPIDYSRPVTEGRFGTICLPNGGVMVGADIFEIAYYGESTQKVFLDNIINGEMEAGRPYIFLPKEGTTQLAVFYTDEANASQGNHNGLIGFIGATEDDYFNIPAGEGNYILQNNYYREVPTGAWARIKSNRAYIKLSAINPHESALAPGRRRISMSVYSEQIATGIENTGFESEAPVKVMIDGQLFIIRGEKMYNANGQLVK